MLSLKVPLNILENGKPYTIQILIIPNSVQLKTRQGATVLYSLLKTGLELQMLLVLVPKQAVMGERMRIKTLPSISECGLAQNFNCF